MSHRQIAQLRAPKAIIVVHRGDFELWLYRKAKDYREPFRLPIAVGKVGDATPAGVYYVDAKTRRPDWLVPRDEDYNPNTWHTVIPFDHPANPFEGGFLSLSDKGGVGIHGVKGDPQLGSRASHGCIRVATEAFQYLYRQTPLGTPVHII